MGHVIPVFKRTCQLMCHMWSNKKPKSILLYSQTYFRPTEITARAPSGVSRF